MRRAKAAVLLFLIALLVVVPSCTCRMVGDRLETDCYGHLMPCATCTYDIGSPALMWRELHINELAVLDTLLMPSGDLTFGDVYLELRPDLDYNVVQAHGKPTQVIRGIYHGYSLPIYAADNEELFLDICVPDRWNGTSDIDIHVDCYIGVANDNKNFNLQLDWEHYTPITNIVPNTSNTATVETNTGAGAAAFQSYHVEFVIDYNIDPGDDIEPDDNLALRLSRIAASANEIAGEIVILHVATVFRRDKIGDIAP